MRSLFFSLVFLLACCVNNAMAQRVDSRFQYSISTMGTMEGLPQNDVNRLFVDNQDFVWFATNDGVGRYDGDDFTYYHSGDRGLKSNMFIDIAQDTAGNIYLLSVDKGIFIFDIYKERFTSVKIAQPTKLVDIECDRHNNVWLRSKGNKLYKLEKQGASDDYILIDVAIPAQDIILNDEGEIVVKDKTTIIRPTMIEDGSGKQTILFKSYQISDIPYIHALASAPNGRLFALAGGNVYSLNIESKSATELFRSDAREIFATNRGDLILSTQRGILYSVAQNDGTYNAPSNVVKGNTIVTHVTEDRSGTIWIGTFRCGVIKFEPHSKLFKAYANSSSVEALYEDAQQNLWIGSMDGSLRVQKYGHPHIDNLYSHKWETPPTMMINDIVEHPISKKIYIGSNNAIFTSPIGEYKFTVEPNIGGLKGVCAMLADENYLWIASYASGLILYDVEAEREVYRITANTGLKSNIVRNVMRDSESNIWFGTESGLYRLDAMHRFEESRRSLKRVEATVGSHNLSSSYVMPILEDSRGDIWVGTLGSGLFILNHNTKRSEQGGSALRYDCEILTTKTGLMNNTIKSLIEDNEHNVWATSNKGVHCIDGASHAISSYGVNDGLLDYEFCELSGLRRKSGEILFGSVKGYNAILPTDTQKEREIPTVAIVQMSLNNEVIAVDQKYNGNIILDKSITYTTDIELKYNQNNFKFRFASPYHSPYGNGIYQYKMDGFDEDWITCTNGDRDAIYTNLAAGDYRFNVRTSNDGVQWSDVRSIDLSISPSTWVSWYALLGYFILFTTLVTISLQQYKHLVKNRQRIFAVEREKEYIRQVTKANLELFSNVSHELRTPLTLIISTLQRLMKGESENAEQTSGLKQIHDNSSMLLRLINDLLNITKIEYDRLNIKLERGDLVAFAYSIVERFESWAEKKSITIEFYGTKGSIYYLYDKSHMESILYNLLSNAIKYTPNGGLIIVEIDSDNDVTIRVSNTGEGISEEQSKHIFNRYYRATDSENGTGLGLSLTKKLVDMHGGIITFDSTEGESTTFTITLPMVDEEGEELEAVSPEEFNFESPNFGDAAPAEVESVALTNQQNNTVLIIDDNIALLELLTELFSAEYQVITAEDGLTGLEKCIELQPAIVITDYMMPGIDGVELCRRVKESPATSHIPVVMLTANAIPETQAQSLKVNVDAFCLKPFDNEILLSMVRSILVNRARVIERFKKNFDASIFEVTNNDLDNKLIDQMVEYIENNAANPEFSIEAICDELNMTQIKLSKKIRDITGQTIVMFIKRVKLRKAAKMLASKEYTVAEATYASGFNDLKHFRTIFKEEFGVLPNAFKG